MLFTNKLFGQLIDEQLSLLKLKYHKLRLGQPKYHLLTHPAKQTCSSDD